MALVSEKLTDHATLDKGLSVSSSRRPEKVCPECLTYKGAGCGVMTTETDMYFCQELPYLLFEDTPLEDSSSTSFI